MRPVYAGGHDFFSFILCFHGVQVLTNPLLLACRYVDSKGRFHAIFHAGLTGIHTFSADGVDWMYGGVAWDNVVNFTNGGACCLRMAVLRMHLTSVTDF